MTEVDLYILDCRKAIEGNTYKINTGLLPVRIEEAEKARAVLADERARLQYVALCIDRVLEEGKPLLGHDIRDEHYSKVTTACRAANFRTALTTLRREREEFDARVAEHIEALRRWRAA